MAFQQQHRAPAPRVVVHDSSPPARLDTTFLARPAAEETREWVLFSPQPQSESISTQTPRTLARSQFSYLGSLDTAARSEERDEEEQDEHYDDELDSLDDGLHAFDDPHPNDGRNIDQSATVLPAHDGLGTFPGNSSPVQQSFWQHEQYNPHRRRQPVRRSSLHRQFDALNQPSQRFSEDEKIQRIEKWRMDQSRAILEEIERETRRVRQRSRQASSSRVLSSTQSVDESVPSALQALVNSSSSQPAQESWWQRLTRQVIQSLIGIDDRTLSFMFGETVESEARNASSEAEMIQHAEETVSSELALATKSDMWEDRLLAAVARELGTLIHQISDHPGNFEAFLRSQDPLPYAGLPDPHARRPHSSSSRVRRSRRPNQPTVPSTPHFAPTLAKTHRPARHRRTSTVGTDASLWGIEEEDGADGADLTPVPTRNYEAEPNVEEEREYWEKDLDVTMVFRYLKNRLSRSKPSATDERSTTPTPHPPQAIDSLVSGPQHHQQQQQQSDSLRRVALIKHHHPLVASSSANTRHQQPASSSLTPATTPLSPVLGRRSHFMDGAESCASQSTKKSKTRHSGSLGSSRNFWDIGNNSVGSGGAWSGGGWGEV